MSEINFINQNHGIEFLSEIQDFGYLIGISKENFTIEFVSENVSELFSIEAQSILRKPILEFIDIETDLKLVLRSEEAEILRSDLEISSINYNVNFYHHHNYIYIELEKYFKSKYRSNEINQKAEKILYSKNKFENWQNLVESIKLISGYDRILVYKYLEEGGLVIAENKRDDLDNYLGLQIRELEFYDDIKNIFLKKKSHYILDSYRKCIPIISVKKDAIDLTYSEFRPLHSKYQSYLNESIYRSRMCVAIIVNNSIWGYVACFNRDLKPIPATVRNQIQILVRIARLNFVNYKSDEQLQFQKEFSKILIELKENLIIEDEILLPNNLLDRILKLTQADGIAYVKDDLVTKFGLTPESDEIIRIKNWAVNNEISDLYYSNSFYKRYKDQLDIQSTSGGVLFKFLDNEYNNFIIWFKKVKSLNDALANKIRDLDASERNLKIVKYSSYSDYETWLLNTEFLSSQWSENDLYVVKEILNVVLESIHVKSVKIRDLYEQLKEINAELDSFSYTISHDLRTPLTVMKLNCQMLQRKLKDETTSKQIKEIIEEIDQISEMMQEILLLSKAKKSEINLVSISTESIISKIISDSKIYYKANSTEVICGECHPILADKTMAYEILLNVVNNAIKYSSKSDNPRVEISSFVNSDKVIYLIKDNGIGIKPEDNKKMFKLFSRMSNTSGYRGNGVGLSIVYRMMERLDGEITYESEVNKGTTFRLEFQKP